MLSKNTHTISNSSTFRGWLEAKGLDDAIQDTCSCIFGVSDDEDTNPIPLPGQRARGSVRNKVRGPFINYPQW